jgi:phage terminase large subunit-like protein
MTDEPASQVEVYAKANLANIVKRLNFCVWTEQSTRWLPMEEWDRGAREISRTGRCFAGLDLGSTSDFSARCLLWGPDADGEWSAEWRMWIPEDRADERIRKGDGWLAQAITDGWIETTPSNVTDYDYIEKAILEDFERYDITKLAFDRWNASQLITHLISQLGEDRLVKFGQGFVDMSPACRELERRINEHKSQFAEAAE